MHSLQTYLDPHIGDLQNKQFEESAFMSIMSIVSFVFKL